MKKRVHMHSGSTFVCAVTEAAYFTSPPSPCLPYTPSCFLSVCPRSLALSRSLSLAQCVPCQQTVIPSIPLCLFMYLPLAVYASLCSPPPIRLRCSASLSVCWGKRDCTLLHRKRQRHGGRGVWRKEDETLPLESRRSVNEKTVRGKRQRQIRGSHRQQGRQSGCGGGAEIEIESVR